jgi:hypothetical protein
VEFIDERQEDYLKLMKSIEDTTNKTISTTEATEEDEQVDFNDI